MHFCLVAIIWCGSPTMTFGVLQQPFKEGGRMGPLGCPYGICLRFLQNKRKGNVRGDLSSSENSRILPLCVLFCLSNCVVSARWVTLTFQVRWLWRGAMCKVDGDTKSDDCTRAAQTSAKALLPWSSCSFYCRKGPASSIWIGREMEGVLNWACASVLHLPG